MQGTSVPLRASAVPLIRALRALHSKPQHQHSSLNKSIYPVPTGVLLVEDRDFSDPPKEFGQPWSGEFGKAIPKAEFKMDAAKSIQCQSDRGRLLACVKVGIWRTSTRTHAGDDLNWLWLCLQPDQGDVV